MMPDAIELVIVTPEKQLLRQKVADVQMPGENGYLGILPGHAPLMTELGIGELSYHESGGKEPAHIAIIRGFAEILPDRVDRKSTRLNSSHVAISYAVFCLKKKKK